MFGGFVFVYMVCLLPVFIPSHIIFTGHSRKAAFRHVPEYIPEHVAEYVPSHFADKEFNFRIKY